MRVLLTTAEDIEAFAEGNAKAYPKLGLLSLVAHAREHVAGCDRITGPRAVDHPSRAAFSSRCVSACASAAT